MYSGTACWLSVVVVITHEWYFRTVNNYLTWRLMYGYVVDLGWEYIHANRVFYTARTGLSEFLGVPKYCFNKIKDKFPDAVGALFIRDHLATEDKAVVRSRQLLII